MYQTYVSRYAKPREWYEVEIIAIDESVKVESKCNKSKFVFDAKCQENGHTNTCVCWTRLDLSIGDKLQICGYRSSGYFIIRDFVRLSKGGETNGN